MFTLLLNHYIEIKLGRKSDILFVGRQYTETGFICFELFIVYFVHVFAYEETYVAVPHPTLGQL